MSETTIPKERWCHHLTVKQILDWVYATQYQDSIDCHAIHEALSELKFRLNNMEWPFGYHR